MSERSWVVSKIVVLYFYLFLLRIRESLILQVHPAQLSVHPKIIAGDYGLRQPPIHNAFFALGTACEQVCPITVRFPMILSHGPYVRYIVHRKLYKLF